MHPNKQPRQTRTETLFMMLAMFTLTLGCQAQMDGSSSAPVDGYASADGGNSTSTSALTSDQCGLGDPEECEAEVVLTETYAALFDVPLTEAAPERWVTELALVGADMSPGQSDRGASPDGPFAYSVNDSTEITEALIASLEAEGLPTDEFTTYGAHVYLADLRIATAHDDVHSFLGLVFTHDLPVPGADPAFSGRFFAAYPEYGPATAAATGCGRSPDDYECGPFTPPQCSPSCSDDRDAGRIMDTECYSDGADGTCDEYKASMAQSCRYFESLRARVRGRLREKQREAGILYANAKLRCGLVAGLGALLGGGPTTGWRAQACLARALYKLQNALRKAKRAHDRAMETVDARHDDAIAEAEAARDDGLAGLPAMCCTIACPSEAAFETFEN